MMDLYCPACGGVLEGFRRLRKRKSFNFFACSSCPFVTEVSRGKLLDAPIVELSDLQYQPGIDCPRRYLGQIVPPPRPRVES